MRLIEIADTIDQLVATGASPRAIAATIRVLIEAEEARQAAVRRLAAAAERRRERRALKRSPGNVVQFPPRRTQ